MRKNNIEQLRAEIKTMITEVVNKSQKFGRCLSWSFDDNPILPENRIRIIVVVTIKSKQRFVGETKIIIPILFRISKTLTEAKVDEIFEEGTLLAWGMMPIPPRKWKWTDQIPAEPKPMAMTVNTKIEGLDE